MDMVKRKGKNSQITRIVLLYQAYSDGPLSTYQQQARGLSHVHHDKCPWAAVLVDLAKGTKAMAGR